MTEEPSKHVEIENLIVGHFDGTLNEKQEKELAAMLASSAEAKQLFLSYMRMEGRLHSLGRDGFLREPIAEPAIEAERSTQQPISVAPVGRSVRQRLSLLAASTSLAVCAAVMLMLLSGVLWPSSVSASSVLQRAQQAAAELIDRTYRVTLSGTGERSPTSELTINVRGGGRFLVRPVDGAFVMGSDGTEYWVTQSGPVWMASDSRSLAPKLKRTIPNMWLFGIAASPNEPLLLDMAGLLSLIERKHDVELIDSASPAEHHVRATLRLGRRNTPRNAPERIDFWADADSGVALRAEVRWSGGRQMRFELVESVKLSDQWYHHSEHAPGRERLDAVDFL
jgi:outer membrane lipoprotein-sorting protein